MAKRTHKTEYEKQKAIWYAKLAKSGFVDIEVKNSISETQSSNRDLVLGLNRKYGQYSHEWRQSKIMYYQMADSFLNDNKFENNIDRVIWEYHANGVSVRNIAKTLNKVRTVQVGRMYVWHVVNRLRNEMKTKYLVNGGSNE